MAKGQMLCIGHINWDVVLHTNAIPDPDNSSDITREHMSSGGSATNTALMLASLGVDVGISGSIGDDEYGDMVTSVFDDSGLDNYVTVDPETPTTRIRAIITEGADPRYLARFVPVGEIDFESIPWDETEHVHTTSFDETHSETVVEYVIENDLTMSFNPSQGYKNREFPHIIENADVLFFNKREAEIFRQRYNFGEVVSSGTVIVVTHGAMGCTAYSPNGVVTHSGFSADTVIDTVGAGDAFIAGFLKAWEKGDSKDELETALEMANACGATAVASVGAPDEIDPSLYLKE